MTILEGLRIIDRAGLPHPEWEFVKSLKDLKKFPKIKDYVGWTIRTVEVRKGRWKNVYANWLPKKLVPAKINEFQKRLKGKATFVVYPSWKWKKGGTVLIEKDRLVIEAVNGAIVDLMRHGKVTARYVFQRGKLVSSDGKTSFLTSAEIHKVVEAKKIKRSGILLEWGVTTQNKFIFYRVEDLREAARLLLKKYS